MLQLAFIGIEGNASIGGFLLTSGANPFAGMVDISYSGMVAGMLRINAHDAAGRLVQSAIESSIDGTTGEYSWNGTDTSGRSLPAGLYTVSAIDEAGNIGMIKTGNAIGRRIKKETSKQALSEGFRLTDSQAVLPSPQEVAKTCYSMHNNSER